MSAIDKNENDLLDILLVEDNPGDILLLRETLREMTEARYRLDHVSSLKDAEGKLAEGRYSVILLDLNLPDGNGLKNLTRISASAPKIPIIIMTGLDDELTAIEAVRAGAQDYLVKGDMAPGLVWRAMHYAVERKNIEDKLHAAKEQAEEAAKAKSEFLAHISHEIRTPMNILLGAAEMMGETPMNDEQRKYLEVFRTSGDIMLHLIDDLLDLSKVEAGKVEIERVSFDLKKMVGDIHKFMLIPAGKRGNRLNCSVSDDVSQFIRSDPHRIRQIIFNLLGNAIKFTENGTVRMDVCIDRRGGGDSLLFSVKDTGIGVPADKREKIFESFSQSDSSTTRRYGGTGLGLTISHKLARLMGGDLWLEDVSEAGSTFTFSTHYTPVEGDEEVYSDYSVFDGNHTEFSEQRLISRFKDTLRVLLVDDSKDNRMLIRAFLGKLNLDIDEAADGREALEKLKTSEYDIVLMDMQMPEIDGYACTREIRRLEKSGRTAEKMIPVVALTAYSREEDRQKCLDAGCSDYLRKPIRKGELIKKLWKFSGGLSRVVREKVPADEIMVKADPSLQDLIPDYLDRKRRELKTIGELAAAEDFEKIKIIAHGMAGTGSSYGFPEITRLGRHIESEAAQSRTGGIEEGARALSEYFRNLKVIYS